jgi:enediyne biosynthesis protein E4
MIRVFLLCFFAMCGAAARAESPMIPRFVDDTKASGVRSIYKGEWQYMVGGGVAVFDCNDDGMPELYVAGGENPSQLLINKTKPGGSLKFSLRKSPASLKAVTGAYPLDVDSDGRMDLVVLRVGESKIFRGLGKCQFEDATNKWNLDGGNGWATAFSATWEKGNQWPTLAFGSYIDPKFENEPWGHCSDNWLMRPNGKQNGFAARIALTPSYCALSMLFTDWNRSGTASLRVANDREYYLGGQEQLWRIPAGAAPQLYTQEEGWKFQRFWGMGIAGADLNGDGLQEYMVTSMADQRLQFLSDGAASPNYRDAPFSMGASAHRPFTGGDPRPSTGWHTQFEDVNNDGRVDLFIVKGNVDSMPDFASKDPSNLLLQDAKGDFIEGAEKAGLLNFERGRGGALVDLNLDGKLDVIIVNRKTNARLWRNVSTDIGNWIGIIPQADNFNRNAVGGWIEIKTGDKTQRREVTIGGGHVSGLNGPVHFGLDSNTKALVRVVWPDGTESAWQPLSANRNYRYFKSKAAEPYLSTD